MAAVAPQPGLEPLIERAAAGARRAEGKLVVVSVDSGGDRDPKDAKALAAYQELTLKLGGQFVTLKSTKPGQALLEYAKKTHVTEIVLARGDHKEKSGPLGSSIKREIIRGASQIDVHVLRAFDTQAEAGTAPEGHTAHVARLASEASSERRSRSWQLRPQRCSARPRSSRRRAEDNGDPVCRRGPRGGGCGVLGDGQHTRYPDSITGNRCDGADTRRVARRGSGKADAGANRGAVLQKLARPPRQTSSSPAWVARR